jgi:hypothetical protein
MPRRQGTPKPLGGTAPGIRRWFIACLRDDHAEHRPEQSRSPAEDADTADEHRDQRDERQVDAPEDGSPTCR